ncbi:MAG: 1-acyl-sn-glycerol-3-phosphate acyltransferase [Desulfarculaceae bacterium]|nr:1-acyl-sn-glycerol-3-phosphate acyltransferase [Desulfarculaceae bacterium]
MTVFRNITFYILSMVFTVWAFCAGWLFLVAVRIFRPRRVVLKLLRRLIVWYGKAVIFGLGLIVGRVRFIDSSRGRRTEDPCVYVVNHRAASDAFLMAVLPGEFVQVVNIWPFKLPILGVCAKLAGYISVREMPFDQFLELTGKLAEQNVSIVSFPEGTRSGSSRIGHFHSGVFRAAVATGLSVVPVCILGSEDKPGRGSLLIRPGEIHVHMLPVIHPSEYQGMSAFAFKNRVRQTMQDFIDRYEVVK